MKFEIYADKKGEWRWRLVRGGRIIADSAEGYSQRSGAIRATNSLNAQFYSKVDVNVVEEPCVTKCTTKRAKARKR